MAQTIKTVHLTQSNSIDQESSDIISFDTILNEIGEIGLYQILNCVLTCVAVAISTFALLNFVFSQSIPDHRFEEINIGLFSISIDFKKKIF